MPADSSEREIEVVFPHILHGGEEEGMDPAAARQQSREDVGSLLEIQPTDNRYNNCVTQKVR